MKRQASFQLLIRRTDTHTHAHAEGPADDMVVNIFNQASTSVVRVCRISIPLHYAFLLVTSLPVSHSSVPASLWLPRSTARPPLTSVRLLCRQFYSDAATRQTRSLPEVVSVESRSCALPRVVVVSCSFSAYSVTQFASSLVPIWRKCFRSLGALDGTTSCLAVE